MSVLDKRKILTSLDFLDNRDWAWYESNVPFFLSPDHHFNEIYWYRWEVVYRHLCYASPESGYIFTEFNSFEPLYWAGNYNGICCAANLQTMEARWIRNPQYLSDYLRYWFRNEGAQPLNYSWSAAYALWSLYEVDGDKRLCCELLPSLVEQYEHWEKGRVFYPNDRGYDEKMGLFWNTGRDSGGEYNLASVQLSEQLRLIGGYKIRGGAGYRPDSNADLYADALCISRIADLTGDAVTAREFEAKARILKQHIQEKLFDAGRSFFLHRWRYDEYSEGDVPGTKSIKAGSFIWETNSDRFGETGFQKEKKGEGRGRELSGYIPWFYRLPDDVPLYAEAWKYLMDPEYFHAPYGPTTAERNDPWFSVIEGECRFNGQSWPFITSKVLTAAANLLNCYQNHGGFTKEDYWTLLKKYTMTQYKEGRPYLAESHHPDEDRWVVDRVIGQHYFHSSYTDLIITGLMGLRPRDDGILEINPLIPDQWEYAALEDISYHGHLVSVIFDRDGTKFGCGRGLMVYVDRKLIGRSEHLRRMLFPLPAKQAGSEKFSRIINYAVQQKGYEFPRVSASYSAPDEPPQRACNGQIWYHGEPLNRWTCRGSKEPHSWFCIDLGTERLIESVRLYFFEDDEIRPPVEVIPEYWDGNDWCHVKDLHCLPVKPESQRANTLWFEPVITRKMRVILVHQEGYACGITECEMLRYAFT